MLQANPEEHLAALLAKTAAAASDWADDEAAMRDLRLMKAEASLLIAVADIGGVWELETVTRALTQVADTAVDAAVRYLFREARGPSQLTMNNEAAWLCRARAR